MVKNLPAKAGGMRDTGSILRSGRSPRVGDANPLQYSCLENSMDRSLAGYSPVQFSSVTQSCLTLYNPMDCSTPGVPVHHLLLELAQTHVHRVVIPSNHLILCHSLLLLPSSDPQSAPTSRSPSRGTPKFSGNTSSEPLLPS